MSTSLSKSSSGTLEDGRLKAMMDSLRVADGDPGVLGLAPNLMPLRLLFLVVSACLMLRGLGLCSSCFVMGVFLKAIFDSLLIFATLFCRCWGRLREKFLGEEEGDGERGLFEEGMWEVEGGSGGRVGRRWGGMGFWVCGGSRGRWR